jgi:GTP diphosphokinase / guanosine-3',5'-bis(diphosphate) 3'-diphosphatase
MRDIHTDLVSVWEQTWSRELRTTISAEDQQRARWTLETLAKWGAPKDSIAAGVIAPILCARPDQRSTIAAISGESSALLAERLLDLRRSLAMGAKVRRGQGYKPSLQALGRLFREAYLGLPSLSFILLLLADHDSQLRSTPVLSLEEAQQTQRVFAPLAEMLGIWSLYRSWNEKSSAVLFPQQYSDISRLLGPAKCYSKSSFKKLFAASIRPTSEESQPESPEDVASSLENKSLLDKAEAFLSFRKSLMLAFSERGIKARIVPIKIYPGLSLRQVREGESREEVARRLRVRIHCRSVSDCYSVLGIIHSLGKPVSHTSLLHLKDQIASPQPNAYRAIHDAITYRDFKKNGGGSVVVECRILTGEMFRVNEDGVLALLNGDFSQSSLNQAWWNQLGELSRQLQKRTGPTEPVSIQSYLKAHEPSSVSDPLYVFTPRGEVVLLPQGSTPLDYAYSIHRKMGHHAIRVEVNGQNVSHGYSLRNADIVRIHHDPAFLGPDLSWLWLVATQSARASIRQGLTWRANAAHDGRAYFEKFLLRSLDRYEREKGYRISVTTERVDDFLLFKSRSHEFAEVSELYSRLSTDQLNKDSSLVQDLVQDLLSEEFASHITTSDGNPLPYELEKIAVCPTCFPIPGERIVGFRAKSLKKLVVHKVGRQSCVRNAKAKKEVKLEWATRGILDQNELIVFRVKGLDRPRLLREVIDAVYKVPGSYLYRVNAQRFGDSHADISMVVKARGFDEFAEIENATPRHRGRNRNHAIAPVTVATSRPDSLHFGG